MKLLIKVGARHAVPLLLFLLVLVLPAHADITTGLISRWKFDENTGTDAADSGSGGNAGTLTNGATWSAPGKIGASAVSLDGTNDFVDAGSGATLDNLTSITLAAWVKMAAVPSVRARIWDKADSGGANGFKLSIESDSTIAVILNISGSDNAASTSTDTISTNTWTHVAATFDNAAGLRKWKIYINATEVAYAVQTTGSGAAWGDAANSLGIGAGIALGSRFFQGLLDEVRVYNRALPAGDVTEDFNFTGDLKLQIRNSDNKLFCVGTTCSGGALGTKD